MISTQEFKKQIGKNLKENMASIGFKGSGFYYILDSGNFIFTFGLQPERHGGSFYAEFGIQPKELNVYMDGSPLLSFKDLTF
jgi:hypothetical protein